MRGMMSRFILLLLVSMLSITAKSQVGTRDFNEGWKFSLADDSLASGLAYDDSRWRALDLPHDWSIEGDFSKDHPATTQGGALPGGIGWYRKTFILPESGRGNQYFIGFDGIYRNSEIWLNGHKIGERPNGYAYAKYALQGLKFGNQQNVIAVRVDNSQQPNSRWYTGSGIYRDVKLYSTRSILLPRESVFISTPRVHESKATLQIDMNPVFIGENRISRQVFTYRIYVYSNSNRLLKLKSGKISSGQLGLGVQEMVQINKPRLWSPGRPELYRVRIEVYDEKQKLSDVTEINTGFRSIEFNREKGFFLNGIATKIKGVCMHHDLGALGAAFNEDAARRQLRILKEMGCNAIRTAHNPPADRFLDLCDEMGFLVMDEAFDMWKKKKNRFDYYSDFPGWWKRDLFDMITHHRNHPSVFMWSIGNEIREQFDSSGLTLTKDLVAFARQYDPTRPVTSALTEVDTAKNFIYRAHALDVIGWNYNHQYYADALKRYPGEKFIASETNSTLSTRGHYDFPSDSLRIWPAKGQKEIENVNGDWSASAFDNAIAYWGGTHEDTWRVIRNNEHCSGLFIWTGFDYLGEPTPYPWPARSSYFGIVDLAGFPKDVYYMYQSEWTDKPVLHVFPHWNWEPGQTVDVWAYYSQADEVELFLNGKSQGIKRKMKDDLHVMWKIPFEPGMLKVISKKKGSVVMQKEIRTAGVGTQLRLTADWKSIKASKKSLAFITATVVDDRGTMVPDADHLLSFEVKGDGNLVATDNGYPADTVSFSSKERRAWKGKALAILRSNGKKGNITLTVRGPGLYPATITINTTD